MLSASNPEGRRHSQALSRGVALLNPNAPGWPLLFVDGRFAEV